VMLHLMTRFARLLPISGAIAVLRRCDCLARRRSCLAMLGACAILTGMGATSAIAQSANGGPNIVFILADDLGIGDLGVYGQNARAAAGLPAIKTPNIDALAAQSLSFSRMYTNPTCSPTRASLLTGFEQQHITKERVSDSLGLRPGEADKTWAQTLQEAGYRTGMYGKWHVGTLDSPTIPNPTYNYDESPTQNGFEKVAGTLVGGYRPTYLWTENGTGGLKTTPNQFIPGWPGPGYSFKFADNAATDYAVQFIGDMSQGDAPFAAYVALNAPHEPFNWLEMGQYANEPWPEVQRQYAAMVSNVDENVGRVLKAIDDPNNDGDTSDSVAANTIVMFSSDNGSLWAGHGNGFNPEFFNSNGPFRGEKSNTLEGGVRTPFFVRWEGVTQPGSVNSDYVGSLADIYPTLAELAGEDVPFGLDGRSMVPAITGQGREAIQKPITINSRDLFGGLNQASWSVQLGDWKLIQRMSNKAYELYNIETDPYETTNLANTRTDIREAYKQIAVLEGALEEPYFVSGASSEPQNVYVSQYKYWTSNAASSDFSLASNWGGGTQFVNPTGPEAKYWNTQPARNWLAKLSNSGAAPKQAVIATDAMVLAMQVEGPGAAMVVSIAQDATLYAYNGVRVESGGWLQLTGGRVKTIGGLEIRQSGVLAGSGVVEGFQEILAGIPEFAGTNFLQAHVMNAGDIDLFAGSNIGSLQINGSFEQMESGRLFVDVATNGDVDSLSISDDAWFDGEVVVDLASGFTPTAGQLFPFLSASALTLNGIRLTGPDASLFAPIVDGAGMSLVYTAGQLFADFDFNGIVNGADLTVWRQNFGSDSFAGDANRDGLVNGADLLVWQRTFGSVLSLELGDLAAVPEPASWLLASMAIGSLALARKSRFKHSRS
jgi:arylsulfatase A-like enzyme